MSYIYIASPYTHPSNIWKGRRYKAVLKYTAECCAKGEIVFSPIVHSHPLTRCGIELPGDWGFWSKTDQAFIDVCSKLRVLKLTGWEKSVGVKAEIEYAMSIGKEIEYVECK